MSHDIRRSGRTIATASAARSRVSSISSTRVSTRYPDLHVYHFGGYGAEHDQAAHGRVRDARDPGRRPAPAPGLRRSPHASSARPCARACRATRSRSSRRSSASRGPAAVKSGTQAILNYERWLHQGRQVLLDEIAAYNEEDCRATLGLLDWLHRAAPGRSSVARAAGPAAALARSLRGRGRPAATASGSWSRARSPGRRAGSRASCWSTTGARRARPGGGYFDRLGMSPEELVEDSEAIGCLEPDRRTPPEPRKKSLVHTLRFPIQDHKLAPGPGPRPRDGQERGRDPGIDDVGGTLQLLRGPSFGARRSRER